MRFLPAAHARPRNRHGTAYAYCQPRNREIPEGHPSAIRIREDQLIEAATWFFNHHVLGPDRLALAQASMPAASDFVRTEHQKQEAVIRHRIEDLDASMDNLMRVLERDRDPEGQLYLRTKKRMAELEKEHTEAEAQLRQHIAAAPPERDDNAGLLDHLPQIEVDLNTLAADRLRRFLDAFNVEIHYDVRSRRATFRAEISGDLIDHLTQQIRRAAPAQSTVDRWAHQSSGTNETGPADSGGSRMHTGSSFSECPRPDTSQNCAPCGRLAIMADLPIG